MWFSIWFGVKCLLMWILEMIGVVTIALGGAWLIYTLAMGIIEMMK